MVMKTGTVPFSQMYKSWLTFLLTFIRNVGFFSHLIEISWFNKRFRKKFWDFQYVFGPVMLQLWYMLQ